MRRCAMQKFMTYDCRGAEYCLAYGALPAHIIAPITPRWGETVIISTVLWDGYESVSTRTLTAREDGSQRERS